jgi:hypothetical protein
MKKISAILLTALLTTTAAQALAQATATSRNPGAGFSVPQPGIKDFKAARDLELERNKFQLGTLDKFQKCLDAAKTPASLNACKTARNEAMSGNLSALIAQGKFDAAYEKPPRPSEKPTVVPSTAPTQASGAK